MLKRVSCFDISDITKLKSSLLGLTQQTGYFYLLGQIDPSLDLATFNHLSLDTVKRFLKSLSKTNTGYLKFLYNLIKPTK